MRKYLNYIVFGLIVLAVVGAAVYHSQHIRSLLDAMAGSDFKARFSLNVDPGLLYPSMRAL